MEKRHRGMNHLNTEYEPSTTHQSSRTGLAGQPPWVPPLLLDVEAQALCLQQLCRSHHQAPLAAQWSLRPRN